MTCPPLTGFCANATISEKLPLAAFLTLLYFLESAFQTERTADPQSQIPYLQGCLLAEMYGYPPNRYHGAFAVICRYVWGSEKFVT